MVNLQQIQMEAFVSRRKDAVNSLVLDCHKHLFEMSQNISTLLEEAKSSSKSIPQVQDFDLTSPPAGVLSSGESHPHPSKKFFKGGFFLGNHFSKSNFEPGKSVTGHELAT